MNTRLKFAIRQMEAKGVGSVILTENKVPRSIFTERELLNRVLFLELGLDTPESKWPLSLRAYVYIGNVPGHAYESPYCPGCNSVVIGRLGTEIVDWFLDTHNNCKFHGSRMPMVGTLGETYADERFLPAYLE